MKPAPANAIFRRSPTEGTRVAMTPLVIVSLVVIGVTVGIVSGMLGIGGAVIIIPILIYVFGFTQARANGTSLAMLLPPIGIFAVLVYHRAGNIDWHVAMLLAAGFAVGAYVGGVLVNSGKVPEVALRVGFAIMLLYVASRMLFRSDGRAMAALKTSALIASFVVTYVIMRLLGRRWKKAPYWPAIYQDRVRLPTQHDYEI